MSDFDLPEVYDGGWRYSEAADRALAASQPNSVSMARAAPHLGGDGLTGDFLSYMAYYEVEVLNADGSTWKPKGEEPPYKSQTGNNCTSEGTSHGIDLLQMIEAADPTRDYLTVPQRVMTEATYAFGLRMAGMRGDNGCSGAGMARGASEIGVVPYGIVEGSLDEDGERLQRWANDPETIVKTLGPKAAPFKVSVVKLRNFGDNCAVIANRGIVTYASNVGFASPRDNRGICRRRGSWNHQMFGGGIIRSDGIETAVIGQSWGRNNPTGPQPFKLPSFMFRAHREDIEAIIDQDDSYGYVLGDVFKKAPLPSRWRGYKMAASIGKYVQK